MANVKMLCKVLQNIHTSYSGNGIKWIFSKRNCGTAIISSSELVEKRNYLFSQEQKRQLEQIGRIEKINVEVIGPAENTVLIMNQHMSTPYDCCKHISEALCNQAGLALLNNTILWDMHRPLPADCSLRFLQFKDKDPYSLNKTFWRTGSFILGAVISKAFRDDIRVMLHSFPPPILKSGSFVYDTVINLVNWMPSEVELRILSGEFLYFVRQNHKIERLSVKKSLAVEIFEGNPVKQSQIPQIAAESEDHLVVLYRVGDHIDISKGPMVGDTSFFGRCSVCTAFFTPLGLYRFQGVALPKGILLNSYSYGILERRGGLPNYSYIPDVSDYDKFYKSKFDNNLSENEDQFILN